MHYIATADTDIGISKDTNQDSVLINRPYRRACRNRRA